MMKRFAVFCLLALGCLGVACGGGQDGSSNGSGSGSSNGPEACSNLKSTICEKAAMCADENGEFVVVVGTSTGTYTSVSQCEEWVLISEKECADATKSKAERCKEEVESVMCGENSNSVWVSKSCDF